MSALVPAVVALLLGTGAAPYVRSRVDSGQHCLWWPAGTLTYNQSQLGNPVTGSSAFTAISNAWQSWQQVTNGCGSLTLAEGPRVPDRTVGYDVNAPESNKNVILFRTQLCSAAAPVGDPCTSTGSCGNQYDCWEHDMNTIALTTNTYDTKTGKIVDADVEFNAASYYFTTVDSPKCSGLPYSQSCVAYDIQNAMTHEAGHALGLDHTNYPGSIMAPTSPPGDLSKRTIDPGSRTFVCDAYPRGTPSQDCLASQPRTGCSATGKALAPWTCVLAIAMLALRRRARPRLGAWLPKFNDSRHVMQWILILAILPLAVGCREQSSYKQMSPPKTEEEKIFYALGVDVGRTFWAYRMSESERRMFELGIYDVNTHQPFKVDVESYRPRIFTLGQARAQAAAEVEKARSKEYMDKAAHEKGAQLLPSGLIYTETKPGTGESPKPTDIVKVHYRGTLIDGTEFDNSYKRGEPNEFTLISAMPCWVESLQKMKVGGKAKLICPSALGYGDKGHVSIEGGAAMIFELELVSISQKPSNPKATLPAP